MSLIKIFWKAYLVGTSDFLIGAKGQNIPSNLRNNIRRTTRVPIPSTNKTDQSSKNN